ncbi:MAG: FISUMP domain-containing protein, partial [Synergistota bacterium]|nr:FISUMP domain-containing protein [Synergistota bacterium]
SGTAVYVETQTPTTNVNGLVSIEIGAGTVQSGDFTTIDWANGPYFIKTETDPAGGTNYTITGTSQLLSVPYALHAKSADTVTGTITETDPVFFGSEAANITATDITNLGNLSGVNTGDQDLSTLATKTALGDSTTQVRSEIPDVSGFLTSESDPSVPNGTQTGEMQYWDGSEWVTVEAGSNGQTLTFINGVPIWIGTPISEDVVANPTTGEIWMDRNLGASQVADSSTDVDAYGDLYQWGRGTDGHQIRTSGTTSTLATSDTPGHGDFIINSSSPYDWRSPQNDNLWQGVSGTNNPCPSGYRLPTEAELDAERQSWSSNDAAGAFASPLKFPVAGNRSNNNGSLYYTGSDGSYWSSTVDGAGASHLHFYSSGADVGSYRRARGVSVRCIKD